MITQVISFWCEPCGKDLDLPAMKDKLSTGEKYWFSRCPFCNLKVVRYITEAKFDPYFRKSKKLALQRKMLRKDLIQPGEDGFQTIYKKEWDKLEAAREAYEKKILLAEKEKREFLKKNSYNVHVKEAAKRVIAAEERLEHGRN